MEQVEEVKVKSLAKAMRVLEQFSVATPELGVSEIAKELGYQKTTVYNILSTFQELGYVAQDPQTDKYYLNLKLLHFGYVINSHLSLSKVMKDPITRISNQVNEVCYLGVPHDGSVLYMDAVFPRTSNFRSMTGETAPMYCTGLGKAMLAYLPQDQLEAVLAQPRRKFTDYTITERADLLNEICKIRQNGYAFDNMEHEYGICCVAVPVFNTQHQLIAAVSVSGPSPRFTPEAVQTIHSAITECLEPVQSKL